VSCEQEVLDNLKKNKHILGSWSMLVGEGKGGQVRQIKGNAIQWGGDGTTRLKEKTPSGKKCGIAGVEKKCWVIEGEFQRTQTPRRTQLAHEAGGSVDKFFSH